MIITRGDLHTIILISHTRRSTLCSMYLTEIFIPTTPSSFPPSKPPHPQPYLKPLTALFSAHHYYSYYYCLTSWIAWALQDNNHMLSLLLSAFHTTPLVPPPLSLCASAIGFSKSQWKAQPGHTDCQTYPLQTCSCQTTIQEGATPSIRRNNTHHHLLGAFDLSLAPYSKLTMLPRR